jgi:hypothetical protein
LNEGPVLAASVSHDESGSVSIIDSIGTSPESPLIGENFALRHPLRV